MNPLLNAEHCILFQLDSSFITKARFSQPELGSIVLIFSEKPDFHLPDRFYLMPDGEDKEFTSYLCTRVSPVGSFYIEATDRTYYTIEAVTKDTPKLREELRVNVSIETEAVFEDKAAPEKIVIKDVSAGGMMFISKKKMEKDTEISCMFPTMKGEIPVNARIIARRPTRLADTYAYGCQFTGLLSKDETAIRNFVFTEDLIQKRHMEES